jgi:calcineurin-like phosphoesterase family protein
MTIYFTSDLHLHHSNIFKEELRWKFVHIQRNPPFSNINEMDKGLVANWNSVVTNSDKVYHLGDFCLTNDIRDYSEMMRKVHGQTIFLRGNHDKGLQHANYYIWRRIEGMKVFMRHWPPWEHPLRFRHLVNIPDDVDLILCGHVHDTWKYRVHKMGQRKVPVINVGTDVWNYRPVSLDNMMEEVEKLLASKRR